VFERALAVDPRDRYGSVESFWRALERAAGVPSSFPERGKAAAAQAAPAAARSPSAKPPDPARPPAGKPPAADKLLEVDAPFDGVKVAEPPKAPAQVKKAKGADEFDSGEFYLPPPASAAPPTEEDLPAPPSSELDEDSGVRRQREVLAASAQQSAEEPVPQSSRRPSSPRFDQAEIGLADDDLRLAPFPTKPVGPSPAVVVARRPAPTPRRVVEQDGASLKGRLILPVVLVALGLGVTFLDMYLARTGGGPVVMGPLRLRWIAWALAGAGIALALVGLLGERRGE
jgi:hypothetical protein